MTNLYIFVQVLVSFSTFTSALNPNYLNRDVNESEVLSTVQYETSTQYETTTSQYVEITTKEDRCAYLGYTTTILPGDSETTTLQYETTTNMLNEEVPTLREEDYIEDCACGIENYQMPRIIGGSDARRSEFPWFVVLDLIDKPDGDHYCGGSIINDRTILTTADCSEALYTYSIRLNVYNYDKTKGINRTVKRILLHPRFDPCTADNDIALIELNEPIEFGDNIRPVCLPTYTPLQTEEEQPKDGDSVTVAGFGSLQARVWDDPARLQKLTRPFITTESCKKTLHQTNITDNMVCAGFPEGGPDTCGGDGGGPLIRYENGIAIQHGIDSFSKGCGRKGYPAVCTKVANYIPWILRNTPGAKWCRKLDFAFTTTTDVNTEVPTTNINPQMLIPTEDPILNSLFGNL